MNRKSKPVAPPLFQRVLTNNWDALPIPLRDIHSINRHQVATGTASVERGRNLASNLIAWVLGFPRAAKSVPVTVIFERDGEAEIWTRQFGEAAFTTRLARASAQSTSEPVVTESFGPLAFDLLLHIENERLHLNPIAWRLFNVTLPTALLPQGNSYEFVEDNVFAFHIEVRIPIVGLIVRYCGKLDTMPEQDQAKLD